MTCITWRWRKRKVWRSFSLLTCSIFNNWLHQSGSREFRVPDRAQKVKQKISGGFRTLPNAEIFARIRSYISTEQKQGVKAWEALTKVFDHTCLSPGY